MTKYVQIIKEIHTELGIDGKAVHKILEERYPEEHQKLLEFLGLDAEKIKELRSL